MGVAKPQRQLSERVNSLKSFGLICEGCQHVITQLQPSAQTGKAVPVDPLFVDLTMNIIAYFLLGVTFEQTSNFVGEPRFDAQRLYAALGILEKNVLLQYAGRSRWLKFLPTSEGKEYQEAQAYLQQTLKPRVAMALQATRASEAESPSVSSSFRHSILVQLAKNPRHDEDSLMAETRNFIFTGHDTTAHTLSFAVGELGLNPRVFEAAQKAVDTVLGERRRANVFCMETLGLHRSCGQGVVTASSSGAWNPLSLDSRDGAGWPQDTERCPHRTFFLDCRTRF